MIAPHDDAAIVAAMVRDFDFPRYAAALFAPAAERRAMLALAAFHLEIIRIPDLVSQPLPGEVRLQWWTDTIEGTEHGGVAGHPVAAELLRAVDVHDLPRAPLLSLIGAHRFDLYDDPMPRLAALETYLDDVQGTLFAQTAHLLGAGHEAHAAFRDAGIARGLADVLTRLPHHAARRRCFLPLDRLQAHGALPSDLFAGRETVPLRAVRDWLIGVARDALRRAQAQSRNAAPGVRAAWLPLATVTDELDALQRMDMFAPRPPPSRLRVLWAQWRMARARS